MKMRTFWAAAAAAVVSAAAAAVVSAAFVVSVVEELLPQAVSVVAAIAPAMVNAITFLSFIMFPSVFVLKTFIRSSARSPSGRRPRTPFPGESFMIFDYLEILEKSNTTFNILPGL